MSVPNRALFAGMIMPDRALFARHALLPGGWSRDVLVEWNARGELTGVEVRASPPIGVPRAE